MSDAAASSREAPWRAGLRAARANLVPGLMVQGVMLALMLAYYFYPPTRALLNDLAEVKSRWGYGYSLVAAVVAGAMVPELMRVAVFQRWRWRPANWSNLAFTIPFWGTMGVIVDFFYRQQAEWFGDDLRLSVVVPKVLVDQFLYNPLFAGPVTVWLYDWKRRGYRFERGFFTAAYYRERIVPTLFANWGVWLPVVAILYSLPLLLQIPLFALALTLWVLIYTWMSEDPQR